MTPMRIGLPERRLRIAEALEAMIGRMAPQEKLPPERILCEEFQVSRNLVREALGRLEAQGRVWRHVGQGTFVGQRPALQAVWRNFSAAHTSPAEVLQVRMLLEPQIAGVAAMRASDIQIAELQALANKCRAATNAETWELWDSKFHHALCEFAGNALLLAVYEGINAVRRNASWTTLRTLVLTTAKRERYAAQHQDIIDAVRARDSSGAYNAMTSHLELVSSDLVGQKDMNLSLGGRHFHQV